MHHKIRLKCINHYSPAGDHRTGDLTKDFEEDVEGPRPSLHVLLQEGVRTRTRGAPTLLPPHYEQEDTEAPCPHTEACVDCGKKGSSTLYILVPRKEFIVLLLRNSISF